MCLRVLVHHPVHEKVVGSMPSQGAYEATDLSVPYIDVSLSPSLSLKSITKISSSEDEKNNNKNKNLTECSHRARKGHFIPLNVYIRKEDGKLISQVPKTFEKEKQGKPKKEGNNKDK